MSKRYVRRDADPAADTEAAATAPLPGMPARWHKRPAPKPSGLRPAPHPRRPVLTSARRYTLRAAALLYGTPPDPPDEAAT